MELILEKKGVTATAERDWRMKWAPAINSNVKTLKGKQYRQNERVVEEGGMCMRANHLNIQVHLRLVHATTQVQPELVPVPNQNKDQLRWSG